MINRLKFLVLDLIALSGLFMSKEKNAKFHLKHVCPKCPESRRELRDVEGNKRCWWESEWKKGNYHIPRSFGFCNYLQQYLSFKTDLREFRK